MVNFTTLSPKLPLLYSPSQPFPALPHDMQLANDPNADPVWNIYVQNHPFSYFPVYVVELTLSTSLATFPLFNYL